MTENSASRPKPDSPSAFAVMPSGQYGHIIDEMIAERCPSFAGSFTWPVIRPILYRMLGYKKARATADTLKTLSGRESFDFLSKMLDFSLTTHNFDRIPATGRVVIAANHPTGLADGVAVWDAITRVRKDVVFFANADAMRVNPGFDDAIIPVEWVLDKRSPAKTRETLKRAGAAFKAEKCIVIFPSGKLAKMMDGKLTEQDWFSTVVGLARKQKAPILPLNLKARNSQLYYLFSKLNGELRDITLFHELLNKRGATFEMTAGQAIPPNRLDGDATALTAALRDYVSYALAEDADLVF